MNSSEKNFLQKTADFLLLATVLIAPLKLGGMLLPGVPCMLPENILEAIFHTAPPMIFVLIAALLLILQLLAYSVPENFTPKNPLCKLSLLWSFLPLAALIGFIDADSLESPVMEMEYTLGLAAFALSAAISISANGRRMCSKLITVMVWGTVFTALLGVNQYFFGFNEMKEYLEIQEKVYNVPIAPEIKARALDVRTYATFTFASALAGMFCLAGALSVVRAVKAGSQFEPANVSKWLFGGIMLLLSGGVFLTTRGRSAFLAVIAAAALCGFIELKSRKVKLLIAVAGVLAVIAGACYIHYAGRGFGSMTERVGYLKSSMEMLWNHPLTGDGWGDFTFHHAINKSFGNEEMAKDPHNIVAAFAGQTGILGGLTVLLLLIYPLWKGFIRLKKEFDWEFLSIFFGLSAFSLHILMDLDWQVPALMIWYAVLSLIAVAQEADVPDSYAVQKKNWKYCRIAALWFWAVLTLTGAVHWICADQCYGKFLRAAGQDIGSNGNMQSVYTVDKLAEKSLRFMPYSHSLYTAWGQDAVRRGNLERAEARYLQVLDMVPRSHAIHSRLGDLYKLQGKNDLADEFYAKADRLFPYYKIFFEKRARQEATQRSE